MLDGWSVALTSYALAFVISFLTAGLIAVMNRVIRLVSARQRKPKAGTGNERNPVNAA
jgi:hypothetical protein